MREGFTFSKFFIDFQGKREKKPLFVQTTSTEATQTNFNIPQKQKSNVLIILNQARYQPEIQAPN
jgi:hypothetical protein